MLKITKILDKLRAQTVKRWTIVHTTKEQSLAEHSFNVAMIAIEIMKKIESKTQLSTLPSITANVIQTALVHDLEEILTGDIPSPFKRYAETRSMALNDLCQQKPEIGKLEKTILKAADHIENTWFILEFGAGSHAKQVAKEQLDFFWNKYMKETYEQDDSIGMAVWEVADEVFNGNYVAWPGK